MTIEYPSQGWTGSYTPQNTKQPQPQPSTFAPHNNQGPQPSSQRYFNPAIKFTGPQLEQPQAIHPAPHQRLPPYVQTQGWSDVHYNNLQPRPRSNASESQESSKQTKWEVATTALQKQDTCSFEIGDRDGFVEFVENQLSIITQMPIKAILKNWIKTLEPKKQSTHPYKTKKNDSGPEKDTRPDWWPKDILHREPDHGDKENRTKLFIHVLTMPETWVPENPGAKPKKCAELNLEASSWIDFLQADVKGVDLTEGKVDQDKGNSRKRALEDIWAYARMRMDWLDGGIEGTDACTYVVKKPSRGVRVRVQKKRTSHERDTDAEPVRKKPKMKQKCRREAQKGNVQAEPQSTSSEIVDTASESSMSLSESSTSPTTISQPSPMMLSPGPTAQYHKPNHHLGHSLPASMPPPLMDQGPSTTLSSPPHGLPVPPVPAVARGFPPYQGLAFPNTGLQSPYGTSLPESGVPQFVSTMYTPAMTQTPGMFPQYAGPNGFVNGAHAQFTSVAPGHPNLMAFQGVPNFLNLQNYPPVPDVASGYHFGMPEYGMPPSGAKMDGIEGFPRREDEY